ncbi:MAG: nicotinate-nucleotide adenylyltransferase [Lachnospiraceae bacterium]|nr:nicotinate-nucleotide adenylyltransferase [Lachnospiraceae bacterium]
MKRIGIMGGTFDPVHNGHLLLGKQAYHEYGLDEIWYMPSHIPPHKRDRKITDSEDRIAMLRLALHDLPYCTVSEFEMERDGTTYTAHTLALLKEEYPDTHFFFIIGADSLYEIEHWYHPEEVMKMATLLASVREYGDARRSFTSQIDYLNRKYGADIRPLHNEEVDIASADIRKRVLEGKDISKDVPETVKDYIVSHGLYRQS